MDEIWKAAHDLEGFYEISNHGNLRRIYATKNFPIIPSLLSPKKDSRGYVKATVYRDREKLTIRIHSLVALAFLGERPEGHQINHIDGNKENNLSSNLEYVTPSRNRGHAFEIGLQSSKGINHSQAKLCDEDVIEIRRLYNTEIGQTQLARKYNLHQTTIFGIVRNKRWTHLLPA